MIESQSELFVIVVKRGNEEKYISKKFYSKRHINCSIKPETAMKFKTIKNANAFWDNWQTLDKELIFIGVKKIVISYVVTGGIL